MATIIANGTEGVLSTLVANGTGTVSTIVAKGSERVNVSDHFWYRIVLGKAIKLLLLPVVKESLCLTRQPSDCVNVDGGAAHNVFVAVSFI